MCPAALPLGPCFPAQYACGMDQTVDAWNMGGISLNFSDVAVMVGSWTCGYVWDRWTAIFKARVLLWAVEIEKKQNQAECSESHLTQERRLLLAAPRLPFFF